MKNHYSFCEKIDKNNKNSIKKYYSFCEKIDKNNKNFNIKNHIIKIYKE